MMMLDCAVVAAVIVVSIIAGMGVTRLSSRNGAVSYFTGDHNLPWWAIAISNTATGLLVLENTVEESRGRYAFFL